jgi:hypothetical protein
MNITRSYARKKNLGNYETADFYASYSQELDDDLNQEQIDEASMRLFRLAQRDVDEQIEAYNNPKVAEMSEEIRDIIERTRKGGSLTVEEYEKVVYAGLAIELNDAKKEWKRSPEYKATLKPRT